MFIMANQRANKTVKYSRDSLNPAFNIVKFNCISLEFKLTSILVRETFVLLITPNYETVLVVFYI